MTSLLFGAFDSRGMQERWICSPLFSYDLLTSNISLLVDVEVGQNCEVTGHVLVKGYNCIHLRARAVVKGLNSHMRPPCMLRAINAVCGKRQLQSHFKRFI